MWKVGRLQAFAPVRNGSSESAGKMMCLLTEEQLVFWQVSPMEKGGG